MEILNSVPSTRPFIEAYLRNRPLFFTLIRPQEAALFRSVKDQLDHPILDLGCGDGFFAHLVFGRGYLAAGLDLDESRIDEAVASGVYGKVVRYDGVHVPFPDNEFGTAISNCVLEHVGDVGAVLAETHRVLKPGGRFVSSVMTDKWEQYMLGALLFGDRYRSFMRRRQQHRNLLSRRQWDAAFERAGFAVEHAVGYLPPRTSLYLDATHYLSVSSLLARMTTGRWVVFPNLWVRLAPLLERFIDLPVDPGQSAAIFYVLQKPVP